MKKELFRIHNLNYQYAAMKHLQDISLFVLEGDRTGFFGLSQSGKDELLQLLCGTQELNILKENIYLQGQRVKRVEELRKFFYAMSAFDYNINWSVAEYICLKESRWLLFRSAERKLQERVETLLAQLDIRLPATAKIEDLSEIEKRMADAVRAYYLGAKVLIINEEFEGISQEEIEKYSDQLRKFQERTKMALLINSHSTMILELFSDKCIVFKDGRIVKKGTIQSLYNKEVREQYLLGRTMTSKKKSMETYLGGLSKVKRAENSSVSSVSSLTLSNGKTVRFDFGPGRITTLLVSNIYDNEYLYEHIVGPTNKLREKIVGIRHLGSREEVFTNMKVGDNLLLPSLHKISHTDYLMNEEGLHKAVSGGTGQLIPSQDARMDTLDTNELIAVTLERWLIYRPKMLVLATPFANCDVYGTSIVKNYLRRFTQNDTAVVIIQAREENVEDISDEIIQIDS